MKVDKKRPLHWFYLCVFLLQSLLGLLGRLLPKKQRQQLVIFYGHKLNGNLLAIYRQMHSVASRNLVPVFLSMDRVYCKQLTANGINAQWAASLGTARLLANADALISDHGLHSLQVLRRPLHCLGLRFFDVWHGIPFKGFDSADFQLQLHYDEIWVASDLHKRLYVDQYEFTPEKVVVTGYARTDQLVKPSRTNAEIRQEIGAPSTGKLILFAPTWAQDAQLRSIFPFGHSEKEFLGRLSVLAARQNATLIMRQHLNTAIRKSEFPNIISLPGEIYPDTESILLVADMLICDWSSIAFDYLLLERPTLFLDVPPPFRKGFSLGPEYRFGPVVGSLTELLTEIEECMLQPGKYWELNRERHRRIREEVYGRYADGEATERCLERLRQKIASYGSSR